MAEIYAVGTELQAKAEELAKLNASFKSQVGDLESQEAALIGMWEGEAKEAFHKAFRSDKIQMDNFYNAIAQYVTVLNNIAAEYNNAEAKNVQIANDRKY